MDRPSDRPPALVEHALGGDRRALARLLSRVERDDEAGRALVTGLYPLTGRARRIGITGPPGAGKSSLIARLIGAYRAAGNGVGVVAVDPSSPLSGGATLGDRIRLGEFFDDPDVFIRSMASRGHRGGLAATTAALGHVLDAAGFDPILIETLGVGQDEADVARLVHTAVVLQVPGLGDSVQTLKAGLIEVADVLVVNKADQPGAGRLAWDLASVLTLDTRDDPGAWSVPIVQTSASEGSGVAELVQALEAHHAHLIASGDHAVRMRRMAAAEIELSVRREIERRLGGGPGRGDLSEAVIAVAERRLAPAEAADLILGPR